MKYPTRVKILGEEYKIEFVNDLRDQRNIKMWGLCKYTEGLIQVNNDIPHQKKQEVLLHEIVHGVYERMQTFDKPKQEEEKVVDNTAVGLMCVMRDNPKVKEWIFD